MNFVFLLEDEKRSALSKLGLNVNAVSHYHGKNKYIHLNDILELIEYFKNGVITDDYNIIEDLINCRLIKNQTIFCNIWLYKNNFSDVGKIHELIKDNPDKKICLLMRLNILQNLLATTFATDNGTI